MAVIRIVSKSRITACLEPGNNRDSTCARQAVGKDTRQSVLVEQAGQSGCDRIPF